MGQTRKNLATEDGITAEFVKQKQEVKYPSETIDLPSNGRLYESSNPLSAGRIEIKYPTAKEEDILTSKNLIDKGVVIDRFIESLIVDKNINLDSLLLGDKNAILIASRILAYGPLYEFKTKCSKCGAIGDEKVDLTKINSKEVNIPEGSNNLFEVTLPVSQASKKFRVLTQGDDRSIQTDMRTAKKYAEGKEEYVDTEVTTRLKHHVISVNGNSDRSVVKNFVDSMLSRDSLFLRQEISKVSPDVNMRYNFECKECKNTERTGTPPRCELFFASGNVQE